MAQGKKMKPKKTWPNNPRLRRYLKARMMNRAKNHLRSVPRGIGTFVEFYRGRKKGEENET